LLVQKLVEGPDKVKEPYNGKKKKKKKKKKKGGPFGPLAGKSSTPDVPKRYSNGPRNRSAQPLEARARRCRC
jgi:hypothetical protein